ncbi:MAG: discoidin domain-containing protein [Chloroflexi bacterium]|nr:discoidin domain-containing protein [Chloroflexota bacterium]
MYKRALSLAIVLAVVLTSILNLTPVVAQDGSAPHYVNHNGQDLFLSGINLAWISFAHDLSDFNELAFIKALDDVAAAHGNTVRWWLHTNGNTSPIYGEDGKVTGLGEHDIENLKRGLDLAYERGILVLPTLWSHDMMNDVEGVPAEANKLMIEDPAYTQAYIDNALIPMVTALKGHPAIVGWEIFNEPEGTTSSFGWTDLRTEMNYIQQFINLLAGAIHRTDPDVKVTNGSWNMQVLTDVDGMMNYYTDERLIEAGGDPDGTLDFYTVHYYPEYFDETTSPFHNPYSHWELDKPLVIGEFPAAGIKNLGNGYKPRKSFQNIAKVMQYIYENGYAGALGWAYTGGNEFGGIVDLAAGLNWVNRLDEGVHIAVNIGDIDHLPTVVAPIENQVVSNKETSAVIANLNDVFMDQEDGTNLTYEITQNSAPDKVQVTVQDTGELTVSFAEGALGATTLEVTATDSAGNYSRVRFVVQITDPDLGNVALGKTAISSSDESSSYVPANATDGVETTRWSSTYEDNQWFIVDLDGVFTINQILLRWEAAFGKNYEIQAWDGSTWQTVFTEPNSDGQIDEAIFETPIQAQFIRLNAIQRGTQWGFSLWEFEVYGARSENQDAVLAQTPPDFAAPTDEAAAPVVTDVSQQFSFEGGDAQGWVMADFWAGGKALEASDAMATDGTGALKLTISTSGTQWEEAGAFVDFPDGVDWSNATNVSVDVYVPAEAANFLAQVFVKTGADWTWANSADAALTPGEWTTVTVDLSTLGAINELHEVGVKVGSGSTAFEGDVFIDNLTLVTLPETEEAAVVTESAQLFGFEGDVEGWVMADFWAGGKSLGASDAMATDGTGALKLTVSTSGTQWEEGGAYFDFPEAVDWSSATAVTVDVYVPAEAVNFLAQVFVKTGPDWTWANTADTALTPGEWTTVTADLSTLGAINELHEIGVKVGSGSTAFEGDIFIDNIQLVTAVAVAPAEVAAGTPSLLFGFEGDVEGWVMADFWAGGKALETSDAMTTEGTGALKLTISTSGTQWEEGGVYFDFPDAVDWSTVTSLTVDVYVPAEAVNFLAQVFVKTGPDWTWANTVDTALTPGEWTTITADLSTLGAINEVHEVGVKVGSGSTAFEGDVFIDNVTLISPAE